MVWLQAVVVASMFSATGETVLLDFYSDSCGPCRALGPTIEALVDEGFPVRKVNVTREPQLARQFGVSRVPCYVMVADGQELDRVVGGTSYSRLKRMFERVPAPPLESPPPQSPVRDTINPPPPASTVGGLDSPIPLNSMPEPPGRPADVQPPGQRALATSWTLQNQPATGLEAALLSASVRLRVEDPNGRSCGSGTIIDARQGEALIVTCGHVFRDSQGQGPIEVDLFGPDGVVQVAGRLVSYDLDRDIGFVSIRVPGPVTTARVAPPGYRVAPGDSVVTVGCNNGDVPTVQRTRITSLDKFAGPPNLEVAGMPVEGRSGGGLFSSDGMLIGVCSAADPTDKEGLYMALASIHAELDRGQMQFVYNGSVGQGSPQPDSAPAAPTTLATDDPPSMPRQMPRVSDPVATDARSLAVEERAALDEIHRRLVDGAEVVCVVRSRLDPQARSEVIILDQSSSTFLGQLAAAGGLREEAEVVCVVRSRRDPQARSEVFILNQASVGFLGQLAVMGRTPDTTIPTSMAIPQNRPAPTDHAADAGGWQRSGL